MLKLWKLFAVLLLVPAVTRGDDKPAAPSLDLAALDAYARKALDDWKAPGLALAIVRDNRVIVAKGFGVREAGKEAPIDERTLFSIASCSKAFTAAALAILVDERQIRWEDKASKYLPTLQLYDPYVTRELTVRDLLCHCSGLATFGGDLVWYNTTHSRDEILHRIRFLKPRTSFRSAFGYQNIMFLAAGQIIPVVAGRSWDEFVHERIFEPLGMAATTSIKLIGNNAATPHIVRDERAIVVAPCQSDNIGPAAAINAGARDMAQWLRLQLGLGKYGDKRVYSESQARAMWSPQTIVGGVTIGPASTHLRAYALGWFVSDYQGKLRVEHDGDLDGMHSKVVLIPELRLGVAAMTNSDTPVAEIIAGRAIDAALGLPFEDRSGRALAAKKVADAAKKRAWEQTLAARAKDTNPSLPLAGYAGKYTSDLYGDVRVAEEDGKLVLHFVPTPSLVADLEHWHYDTFRAKWRRPNPFIPDGWATFVLDRAGKAVELKVDAPNPDFDFTELELKRK
jgi:CubicO group peptidase (beta-lactamase class C family)